MVMQYKDPPPHSARLDILHCDASVWRHQGRWSTWPQMEHKWLENTRARCPPGSSTSSLTRNCWITHLTLGGDSEHSWILLRVQDSESCNEKCLSCLRLLSCDIMTDLIFWPALGLDTRTLVTSAVFSFIFGFQHLFSLSLTAATFIRFHSFSCGLNQCSWEGIPYLLHFICSTCWIFGICQMKHLLWWSKTIYLRLVHSFGVCAAFLSSLYDRFSCMSLFNSALDLYFLMQ